MLVGLILITTYNQSVSRPAYIQLSLLSGLLSNFQTTWSFIDHLLLQNFHGVFLFLVEILLVLLRHFTGNSLQPCLLQLLLIENPLLEELSVEMLVGSAVVLPEFIFDVDIAQVAESSRRQFMVVEF